MNNISWFLDEIERILYRIADWSDDQMQAIKDFFEHNRRKFECIKHDNLFQIKYSHKANDYKLVSFQFKEDKWKLKFSWFVVWFHKDFPKDKQDSATINILRDCLYDIKEIEKSIK